MSRADKVSQTSKQGMTGQAAPAPSNKGSVLLNSLLSSRTFTDEDQRRFAQFSGDCNPMHMDRVAARRMAAGLPVVHGIHLLLWALEFVVEKIPHLRSFATVTGTFEKFVCVGDAVSLHLQRLDARGVVIEILSRGLRSAVVSVVFEVVGESGSQPKGPSGTPIDNPMGNPMRLTAPLALTFDEMAGREGQLAFATAAETAVTLFPRLCSRWGDEQVSALTCTSALVGMACPGLYSIYNKVTIFAAGNEMPPGILSFAVSRSDARFRRVEMQVAAQGVNGKVTATARLPPVEQACMTNVMTQVGRSEFAGVRALIIGGSRGLGEVTAKIIAAGGGQVVVTYHSGEDDARRIAAEIRIAGGACEFRKLDVLRGASDQLDTSMLNANQLYYFATPRIARSKADDYNQDLFAEFVEYFVNGFQRTCMAMRNASGSPLSVFYPSTEFITNGPPEMTEYAMAKAAGEILCVDIARKIPGLRIKVVRLPKLKSDQTAGVLAMDVADPLGPLLGIVRSLGAEA